MRGRKPRGVNVWQGQITWLRNMKIQEQIHGTSKNNVLGLDRWLTLHTEALIPKSFCPLQITVTIRLDRNAECTKKCAVQILPHFHPQSRVREFSAGTCQDLRSDDFDELSESGSQICYCVNALKEQKQNDAPSSSCHYCVNLKGSESESEFKSFELKWQRQLHF